MLHGSRDRRGERPSLRVPVVMPVVEVSIDRDGLLDVLLDREPYSADGVLHRKDLQHVLAEITADLGTPIRVEVRESDGVTFTDIVTPASSPDEPLEGCDRDVPLIQAVAPVLGEVSGGGFLPDEEVAVAVVVAHQVAGPDGITRLRLPPAVLAAHRGLVVLMGQTSGTVAVHGADR